MRTYANFLAEKVFLAEIQPEHITALFTAAKQDGSTWKKEKPPT
jgi:hypothetical protein